MQWLVSIFENLAVMVLTIVVLVATGYLMLLILQWAMKIKSGSREAEGLADLWQESLTKAPPGQEKQGGERRNK